MEGIKESSLRACLCAVGLSSLPARYHDGDGWWLRAIVLVRKRGVSESYCVACRDADGRVRYVRDFGVMAPIGAVLSIHPYVYLDVSRFGNVYSNPIHCRAYLVKVFEDWVCRHPDDMRYRRLLDGVRVCGDDSLGRYDRERIMVQMDDAAMRYELVRDEERAQSAAIVDANIAGLREAVRERREREDVARAEMGKLVQDDVPADVVVKRRGRRGRKSAQ